RTVMLHPISRREWLSRSACGFGALALAGLSARSATAASADPLAPKLPHFAPKAKRVIFLFMQGGVSHVDSYDYKPRLIQDAGKQLPFDDARALANSGTRATNRSCLDRKSTRLNSSHVAISYAVFCLKKKKKK